MTLDLSDVDPTVALMVESRIGTVHPDARTHLEVVELPVREGDLPALIHLAITGKRRAGGDVVSRYNSAAQGAAPTGLAGMPSEVRPLHSCRTFAPRKRHSSLSPRSCGAWARRQRTTPWPCSATASTDTPSGVEGVDVYGQQAGAVLTADTPFLLPFPGGWVITAAGCVRRSHQPYQ